MVALLIGINVLAILWQVFTADQKRFARDQGKLAAMQAALLFAETLETDLREMALYMPDANEPDRDFTLDRPVRIEDQGRKLGFVRFSPHDPASASPKVKRATYSYDPQGFRIRRTIGTDDDRFFKTLVVENIRYTLVPLLPKVDALGLNPAPVLFRPNLPLHFLKYEITASPETGAGREPKDVPPEQKVTLVNAVALSFRADRANYPVWSFNGNEIPAQP
jgi:hypothetical protein